MTALDTRPPCWRDGSCPRPVRCYLANACLKARRKISVAKTETTVECPSCDGTGQFWQNGSPWRCNGCHGTGHLPIENQPANFQTTILEWFNTLGTKRGAKAAKMSVPGFNKAVKRAQENLRGQTE